jgi:polyhydroxyalkanoate synthesis regulator phasin
VGDPDETSGAATYDGPDSRRRGLLEELVLASVGWVSMTGQALDELADELATRVGASRDEMGAALRDAAAGWRKEADRLGVRRPEVSDRMLGRLRLVRREEIDDIELRLAQLEHRVRLLERGAAAEPPGAPGG